MTNEKMSIEDKKNIALGTVILVGAGVGLTLGVITIVKKIRKK